MATSGRLIASALLSAAILFGANRTQAAFTEGKCLQSRSTAAGKYALCQEKALGALYGGSGDDLERRLSKCRIKYSGTWAKLQKAALGSGGTCDQARFQDNGDGTVTDWLTGLVWEQKTDDASAHDKDNTYTWTDTADGDRTNADGTAFTGLLATLNGSPCFARQCDWRLPTLAELQTILLEECTASGCTDPVFGSTDGSRYWTSTADAGDPNKVWIVDFGVALNIRMLTAQRELAEKERLVRN